MSILQEILFEGQESVIKVTLITGVEGDPIKIIKDSVGKLMTKMSKGVMGDGVDDEVVYTTNIYAPSENMAEIKNKLKEFDVKITDEAA